MNHFNLMLVIGFFLMSLGMGATWAYAKKIDNYSIVDAVWALCFSAMTLVFALLGEGFWPRKLLILACVSIWSLRLGLFLWIRIQSHHPKEDGRYLELREKYRPHVERGFFWFFQYQAWSVVLLSVPFLIICQNETPNVLPIEWVGAALWAGSLFGEATADRQAKQFKSDPKNAKRVCDQGLWKYSRHPNYFFESCVWWSYFIFSLGSNHAFFTVYCPLIMLFLLVKVTGVPMSEAQSLKSRGDAYREYQKKTSAFIPWFPKTLGIGIAFIGLFSLQTHAFALDFTAKIYEIGKTSVEPVFVQKTHIETGKDGNTLKTTDIMDAQGKIVLTEHAVVNGPKLISQTVDKFQDGDHYVTLLQNDHVIFRQSKISDASKAKMHESSEGEFDNFVSGPTAEAYLQKHWDELLKGQTLSTRFAVNEVKETIGFDFKLKGHQKIGNVDAIWIEMKPSSLFISMVADAMNLYLDPDAKHYLKFVGRTPLKTLVDGKLKPFDGEILYQYPN